MSPGVEPLAPPSFEGLLLRERVLKRLKAREKDSMLNEGLHFLPRSRDDGGVALPVKGWRDFEEDSTGGMLYLARVGKRRDWYVIASSSRGLVRQILKLLLQKSVTFIDQYVA